MLFAVSTLFLINLIEILNGEQVFKNIGGCDNDIGWRRDRGPQYSILEAARQQSLDAVNGIPIFSAAIVLATQSGVAVLDYDNDGDDDILVTNGPNRPNSLYTNLYNDLGYVKFVNLASEKGISGLDENGNKINNQDGAGTCYGDIDNDGDSDIVIVGRETLNMLYINNDGVFEYKSDSGIDVYRGLQDGIEPMFTPFNPDPLKSAVGSSCTFGDINNDGYIDLFIANSGNATIMGNIFLNLQGWSEANELYLNNGDNTFTDISDDSGIRNTVFRTFPLFNGIRTISWATTMVDFNEDGFIDIIHLDDALSDGIISTRGQIQIFLNNGDNPTTFRNAAIGRDGGWMGIEVADLNYDGKLDIFASNFGGYADRVLGPGTCEEEIRDTRVFFGTGNESTFNIPDSTTYLGPGIIDKNKPFYFFETDVSLPQFPQCNNEDTGRMRNATVFTWGCALLDFDNDGDLDILHHGGLDYGAGVVLDNPGVLMENDGNGNFKFLQDVFELDPTCTDINEHCTIHSRRYVKGVAIGDFNKDGRYDVVSTAESIYKEEDNHNLDFVGELFNNGDPRDDTAFRLTLFNIVGFATGSPLVKWNGKTYDEGDLFIEENILENNNNWAAVRIKGTVAFNWNNKYGGYWSYYRRLSHYSKGKGNNNWNYESRMNADGIGSIIRFKPFNTITGIYSDKINIQPVEGGSSMLSQHSLEKIYGMGTYELADIDITFSGGGRNYFADIESEERLILYEIPCYYNENYSSFYIYRRCVRRTTQWLYNRYLISWSVRNRMRDGNIWAYQLYHGLLTNELPSERTVTFTSDSSNTKSLSSTITIVIISIAAVILLIIGILYYIFKRRQKQKQFFDDQSNIKKMNHPMEFYIAKQSSNSKTASRKLSTVSSPPSNSDVTPPSVNTADSFITKVEPRLFTVGKVSSSSKSMSDNVNPEDVI